MRAEVEQSRSATRLVAGCVMMIRTRIYFCSLLWMALWLHVIAQAPVFVRHPQSVSAAFGNQFNLTASAESFLPFTTIWLKDGLPVSALETWIPPSKTISEEVLKCNGAGTIFS